MAGIYTKFLSKERLRESQIGRKYLAEETE